MHPSIRYFITGLCVVMLAGCGVTKPSRFYILTPVEEPSVATAGKTGPALGIGPVAFPAYLDRPEIAHRSGDNQLHYAGSHRWAEPLKTTFTRTLAENLAILLPTDRITLHPWPRSAPIDYQLVLHVTRFDADASGTVVLSASLEIVRPEGDTVSQRKKVSYSEPAGSMDYPAIVAAQSRAVEKLSREVADAINNAGMPAGR